MNDFIELAKRLGQSRRRGEESPPDGSQPGSGIDADKRLEDFWDFLSGGLGL